jgi:YHS domain-containing protein
MTVKTLGTGAGHVGVLGLALLGLGTLGGCGTGDHGADHGAISKEEHSTGDGQKGQDHGSEPAPAKDTPVAAELKSIQPSRSYPLTTCVVSGDSLTEMGGPIAFEYEGTEIQFCCKGCIKDFKKDPARYMQMVRAAKK